MGDVVAGVAIVAAAFTPFDIGEFRPGSHAVTAVVIAPAALLPLRRRWPIPVLAGCLLLYGVAASTGILAPGAVLATAIALFHVANRMDRRTTLTVTCATVVAMALLSLLSVIGNVFDPRSLQFAVMIAFAAAAGDATRSRREYLIAVIERAERAEQTRESEARRRVTEERLRIARDLHDVVAHQISVISLNAGVASSTLRTRPERAEQSLGVIRSAARTVLTEIGDLLRVLRASDDDPANRAAVPQPGLDQLDRLVRGFVEAGLSVSVRTTGDLSTVTGAVDVVAYRVVQEGLTNAHKHGTGHRAHVLIELGDQQVTVVVTNPAPLGAADDRPEAASGGHGLVGLRERVASVRGVVETGLSTSGFRLAACLPLPKEDPR
ncbi:MULTISPECIES: sensor histidine kinase [Micromonospora]|uniref:histidine kinase n=1 Tax=Micromonospora yangpuensis TaxID=683228 RepID=A0A1C6VGL6_9ACTN|nr:histidine kinase [Micromonospora yangpuensis]GGL99087.1 two-component sensor histidine kinase [Micromonospora yangpuensis]SCL65486.1 Signal transduction histidine kinase [Micromonospora yangpuensis]